MTVLSKLKKKFSGKREIRATLCYFLSNICTKAFGFITIPLYTHILSTSEYGYLNTYNAWVSLLSVVMGLSLNSALIGKIKLGLKDRAKFQSSVMILSLISAGVITFTVTITYILIFGCLDVIVLLALIQGYGLFTIHFILQEWVLENKYIVHSLVSVGSVIIPIGITCLIINKVFLDYKYYSVIIPRFSVIILLMIVIVITVVIRGKVFYNKNDWIWSLKYCIPLVFHSLSLTIMLQADRIMISYLYSYEESGIYSFIYNVTLVIGVLISALENTWKGWFFNNADFENKKHIQKRCKFFITAAMLGVSIYVFVAPELVKILAAEEYHTEIFLIGPIAFAYIISFFYDFLVYVEYKKEATKNIALASIIAALVNIGLNIIIIPKFGGVGAAVTTCIAYLVQFFLHLKVVSKLEKNLFPFRLFIPFFIIGITIMAAFFISLNLIIIRYGIALSLLVSFGVVVYKNKALLV